MDKIPFLLVSGLLAMPLVGAWKLTCYEYLRLGLIAGGLGLLIRHPGSPRTSAQLLALVLIFILYQFQAGGKWHLISLAACSALIVGATAVGMFTLKVGRPSFSWHDGVVGILTLVVVLLVAGASWNSAAGMPWGTLAKIFLLLVLWLLCTKLLNSKPAFTRWIHWGAIAVFGALFLVGCFRIGLLYRASALGDEARRAGKWQDAIAWYQQAAAKSKDLGLEGQEIAATLGIADVYYRQGNLDEATKALSLENGFKKTISFEDWEGPDKGNLYGPTSCWKEVMLYKGEVEIRIYAMGTPAMGAWPIMRVKLGGRTLDEVSVTSESLQPYVFNAKLQDSGPQKLEISFLNDFFQDEPRLDRNLLIRQAEITYREIAWP